MCFSSRSKRCEKVSRNNNFSKETFSTFCQSTTRNLLGKNRKQGSSTKNRCLLLRARRFLSYPFAVRLTKDGWCFAKVLPVVPRWQFNQNFRIGFCSWRIAASVLPAKNAPGKLCAEHRDKCAMSKPKISRLLVRERKQSTAIIFWPFWLLWFHSDFFAQPILKRFWKPDVVIWKTLHNILSGILTYCFRIHRI